MKTLETEKHKESKTIVTFTDDNGAYSVGPMHSDIKVEVSAKKDGYVLSDAKEKGSFTAMKLGQITIKVDNDVLSITHRIFTTKTAIGSVI